jgi:hypothetical protein
MANAVNYLAQIQTGQTIQAVHVNQFVNALSGSVAYDLVTSGSYRIVGPLYATASWATNALNAKTVLPMHYRHRLLLHLHSPPQPLMQSVVRLL